VADAAILREFGFEAFDCRAEDVAPVIKDFLDRFVDLRF